MATTRVTRAERQARTRADLLAAARRVFLRRGFHGASLEEIAQEAGYTKGAVYSNFADKDALYLAVLEAHYEERIEAYAGIMLEGEGVDEALRGVASFMADADAREPRWLPLLSEFVAHAARNGRLRPKYVATRNRFLEAIARIIDATQERYEVTYRLSPFEIARVSSLLIRGFSAERQLEPTKVSPELFVELHTAFLHGLIEPSERSTA
jgi:AcrR family transcriptional regulator